MMLLLILAAAAVVLVGAGDGGTKTGKGGKGSKDKKGPGGKLTIVPGPGDDVGPPPDPRDEDEHRPNPVHALYRDVKAIHGDTPTKRERDIMVGPLFRKIPKGELMRIVLELRTVPSSKPSMPGASLGPCYGRRFVLEYEGQRWPDGSLAAPKRVDDRAWTVQGCEFLLPGNPRLKKDDGRWYLKFTWHSLPIQSGGNVQMYRDHDFKVAVLWELQLK